MQTTHPAFREAKAMTRAEVIKKALEKEITWTQAATICGLTPRHLARLRARYERLGTPGLMDGRAGRSQPRRISEEEEAEICRLKREVYPDFTVRHFQDFLEKRHGFRHGYTWTLTVLQKHGLVERGRGRGKYRRKRERRPMRGMLLHLDASRHAWMDGQPMWDLNVAMDDADGRILFARFVEEEGTRSTLEALAHVFRRYGRFCELYTDRGSHFCRTSEAEKGPDEIQQGQVTRVLKTLGIGHIRARSPEARGRSERAFGTIQGRLPQELRLEGITDYEAANRYLEEVFVPDFNQRFTVTPEQSESAFTCLGGFDLDLLLSVQHERRVRIDNTVAFEKMELQLESTPQRMHFARCPVLVHRFLDDTLGVSFQGNLIGRFTADGRLLGKRPGSRQKRQGSSAGTGLTA
jgi:transposase